MTGNIVISAIIVLGFIALLAGAENPIRKARRQRWREDQLASEKPFQMGNDQGRQNKDISPSNHP